MYWKIVIYSSYIYDHTERNFFFVLQSEVSLGPLQHIATGSSPVLALSNS